MAEKDKKQSEQPAAEQAVKAAAKPRSLATWGLFGGIMLVEAVAVFVCVKFFVGYAPETTHADTEPTSQPWEESKELEVAQLKVVNVSDARTVLYKVQFALKVRVEAEATAKQILELKRFEINDALSRVIRSSDQRYFEEPGLETLKRMVRHELSRIFEDEEMIEQVLIPECMPMPTSF